MSCTCRIGGKNVCGFCYAQKKQAERNADLQQQLLALATRVVKLEGAFLAQAKLVEELAARPEGVSPKETP